jgi:hypothetical protein
LGVVRRGSFPGGICYVRPAAHACVPLDLSDHGHTILFTHLLSTRGERTLLRCSVVA